MTKQFTIESERINSTYSIRILKDGEVIFEVSNWDSLSNMHKRECEEFVDYLNNVVDENESLKQYKQAVNDILDSYYQKDLSPSEEMLIGAIARELNIDLHYKYKR